MKLRITPSHAFWTNRKSRNDTYPSPAVQNQPSTVLHGISRVLLDHFLAWPADMQHCFYPSACDPFDSSQQDTSKGNHSQSNDNFYWSQFPVASGQMNYPYSSVQPQWFSHERPGPQCFPQWNQTLPPHVSSPPPSVTIQHPTISPQPHSSTSDDDLEVFAEYFKQRRMKLGATQADVGKAIGAMQIPGVESLSQSTICRFESLTLSRTNMLTLRPLLQVWLDRAEILANNEAMLAAQKSVSSGRRKRTCITDGERRALEAYFEMQPQPSGERIAQIASLISLPKSVVRVWFCNQRQKQKRLKFGCANARLDTKS